MAAAEIGRRRRRLARQVVASGIHASGATAAPGRLSLKWRPCGACNWHATGWHELGIEIVPIHMVSLLYWRPAELYNGIRAFKPCLERLSPKPLAGNMMTQLADAGEDDSMSASDARLGFILRKFVGTHSPRGVSRNWKSCIRSHRHVRYFLLNILLEHRCMLPEIAKYRGDCKLTWRFDWHLLPAKWRLAAPIPSSGFGHIDQARHIAMLLEIIVKILALA